MDKLLGIGGFAGSDGRGEVQNPISGNGPQPGNDGRGEVQNPLGAVGSSQGGPDFHSFMDNTFGQIAGLKDLFSKQPDPTNPGTPFHDMLSQLPQGSNIFDMLHTGGMGAISQMPSQLQQFLQARLSPIDHNPWERAGSGMPGISLTNSSYQNNG